MIEMTDASNTGANSQGGYVYVPMPTQPYVCPTCGHCPTCGQSHPIAPRFNWGGINGASSGGIK
jgi:hypothetical protein